MTHDMYIQTVTGPVDAASLGFTLPAEHFYIQQWEVSGHSSAWQLEDDDVFAEEIAAFQAVGGTCVVDQTPACIGRKPEKLVELTQGRLKAPRARFASHSPTK